MKTLTYNDLLIVTDILQSVPTMGRWAFPYEIVDSPNQEGICKMVREKLIDMRVDSSDDNLVFMIDDVLRSRMMQPNFFA